MSKILVTGGAGFIGSHVCDALLNKGYFVVCVDNFNDYYDPGVKENNIKQYINNSNFKLYRKDIRDFDSLSNIFNENDIDKVIHLAARAGVRPSIKQPLLYQEVNIKGTANLLELSKRHNIKNFIFASSSSVYGERREVPFKESDRVDNPISPYAATKKSGELLCYTYSYLYDLPVTCLRFFTVYGPKGRPDMAPYKFVDLIEKGKTIQIYTSKEQFEKGEMARDFTYIDDIVEGILFSLENPFDYEIINLGRGEPVKLNKFIEIIETAIGKQADKEFIGKTEGDVTLTYADISKAKNLLSYKSKTSLLEGMKNFIDWYKREKAM